MPGIEFYRELGLFLVEDHFDAERCERLREAASRVSKPAEISRKGRDIVDLEVRRSRVADVSEETLEEVRAHLLELKPKLEDHFGLELEGCERPVFLRYETGDFFAAHQDGYEDPDSADYIQKRRVSVVVFLNTEVEDGDRRPGEYDGGSLLFHGLMPQPEWSSAVFPLAGREGLLVAFPSHLVHEVQPVKAGVRYTIVTWFY